MTAVWAGLVSPEGIIAIDLRGFQDFVNDLK